MIQIYVSCQSLAPRTCQVPKTPKSDQGGGESRESKRLCAKPGESKGSTIDGCDPLENNSDVLELNAFVYLFLRTEPSPQDGIGPRWKNESISAAAVVLWCHKTHCSHISLLSYELFITNSASSYLCYPIYLCTVAGETLIHALF